MCCPCTDAAGLKITVTFSRRCFYSLKLAGSETIICIIQSIWSQTVLSLLGAGKLDRANLNRQPLLSNAWLSEAALCGERRALSGGPSAALCSGAAGNNKRRFWQDTWGLLDAASSRLAPVAAGSLPSALVCWGFNDAPCRRRKVAPTPAGTILAMPQLGCRTASSSRDPCLSSWWWWWWLWWLW